MQSGLHVDMSLLIQSSHVIPGFPSLLSCSRRCGTLRFMFVETAPLPPECENVNAVMLNNLQNASFMSLQKREKLASTIQQNEKKLHSVLVFVSDNNNTNK